MEDSWWRLASSRISACVRRRGKTGCRVWRLWMCWSVSFVNFMFWKWFVRWWMCSDRWWGREMWMEILKLVCKSTERRCNWWVFEWVIYSDWVKVWWMVVLYWVWEYKWFWSNLMYIFFVMCLNLSEWERNLWWDCTLRRRRRWCSKRKIWILKMIKRCLWCLWGNMWCLLFRCVRMCCVWSNVKW